MPSINETMRVLLYSLLLFSIAYLAESLVSPGRVGSTRSTIRKSGKVSTGQRTPFPLKDLIDGNLQWYAAGSTSTSTATASKAVSQSTIDRKLRNAAERFIKFQSGYFSPLMPNDNNVELNNMNGRMNNMNSGYYNDGYNYNYDNGYNNGYNPYEDRSSILAEDFVFRSDVVGPLTKWDYIDALDYFRVYEAFPDINPNCYGFTVDVIEPLKVRFFVKATGTYQYPLGGFLGSAAARLNPPDGRQYMGSTEAWSITFNDLDRMQVKSISAGYVVDRFEEDGLLCTTGGKGLVFGILNTIGMDYIPTKPGSKSLELTQWLTGQFAKGGPDSLFPKSSSERKTIPQWWSDKRLGAKE